MKHLKMLGLAVVAAAALMAVIGAGTASATELCSTATTPCSGTKYGVGTTIRATSTNATLKTFVGTVACTHSEIVGEVTGAGGSGTTAVTGKTQVLEFSGCTLGETTCTITQEAVGNSSVTGGSASATATFNYNVTSKTGSKVVCGSLINCVYSTSSAVLKGQNTTSGTPTIKAENISLAREGGICPSESIWNATYTVVEPDPLYVV